MKWFVAVAMMSGLAQAAAPSEKTEQQFMADAEAICIHESTERGDLNKSRFGYCIKQQNKAYADIKWANKTLGHKGFYSSFIYPYCYKKGTARDTSSPSSIAFCIKDEVDAFESVMYFSKKYDREKALNIATAQMAKFGSWRMAAYKLKHVFEPAP